VKTGRESDLLIVVEAVLEERKFASVGLLSGSSG
jgi:hypothetical protein